MSDGLVDWVNQRVFFEAECDIKFIVDVLACEVDSDCTNGDGFLWSGQWKLYHKPQN